MQKDTELLLGYLSRVYSKEYIEKIMMGIKNPAKYPWITKELNHIYQTFQKKKKNLMDKEFLRIFEIIEDELAYTSLICQDSKCKPFNFIDFKK
ncbi:MAG: hypothetical protein KGD73_13890 [Candidatus Lokiarchaeota archaeon]|nr:hypothetical protein [Candidatus Lokiarchaeota archaeon]